MWCAHRFALIKRGGKWESIETSEHKKAQQELRRTKQYYHILTENLNEDIWVVDKNDITTFVNGQMAQMLGYNSDEMLGKKPYDFMDENEIEKAKRYRSRRLAGIKEQLEQELIRRDGKKIWTLIGTASLFDEEGKVNGTIRRLWVYQSASRQKKKPRDLRLCPKLNPQLVMEIDLSGNIHYLNSAAGKLFFENEKKSLKSYLADFNSVADFFKKDTARTFTREIAVGDRWYVQLFFYEKDF